MRDAFPQWVPFIGPEGGPFNLVPVDFVAKAIDHIAHQEGLDGRAFHIVDPAPLSLGDTLNTFCRAAHAPEFALRIDRRMARMLPGGFAAMGSLPAVQRMRQQALARLGIPDAAFTYMDYPATFDATDAQAALAGSGVSCPPLHEYAWKVWDYWERHLDPQLAHAGERASRRRWSAWSWSPARRVASGVPCAHISLRRARRSSVSPGVRAARGDARGGREDRRQGVRVSH